MKKMLLSLLALSFIMASCNVDNSRKESKPGQEETSNPADQENPRNKGE